MCNWPRLQNDEPFNITAVPWDEKYGTNGLHAKSNVYKYPPTGDPCCSICIGFILRMLFRPAQTHPFWAPKSQLSGPLQKERRIQDPGSTAQRVFAMYFLSLLQHFSVWGGIFLPKAAVYLLRAG